MRFLIVLLTLVFPLSLSAQEMDSKHKDWSVFTLNQDGGKVCYITSSPTAETGNYRRRGTPYILVTYRDKGISEVSVSSGYPYKNGSNVEVRVDNNQTHKFFTTNETPKIAWAKDITEDNAVITEMKKGARMAIKGHSKLGTYSKDSYSLYGFTKAFARMQDLCK